jgi:sigma-E factor negative regulatory protein RseC
MAKLTATDAFVHSGVVTRIANGSVFVALDPNLHCDSCRAKGVCGVSDAGSREVEITDPQGTFRLNEPVEVLLKKDLGNKALFWAYLFPFLLMMLTLFTASVWLPEWMAGLVSLFILIPYYGSMALLQKYFKRTFKISILRI